ncbi:hypothetical protein VUR80DRAFT_4401 [Thermomyces stellatus]
MGTAEISPLLDNPARRLSSATAESGAMRRRAKSGAGAMRRPSEHKRPSKRRKARSALRRFKNFALKHTWTIPLLLMVPFAVAYAANPTESNPVHPFIFPSYKLDNHADPAAPAQYGKGLWDVAFVCFYTIVLSFTREFIMQELLRPLAQASGIASRGKQQRFMEQMYTAVYFGIMGPVGIYVMRRTPVWYFNTRGMYENFPHRTHEAEFKVYYLFQAAYWTQQAIVMVLGLEKRRKDFKELVGHHIVTLALIALSYRFHFTYIGIAVYLTHDLSDFFLATSKSLHYVNSRFVGPYFALCIGMWIYLRHYLNLRILYSLLWEYREVGPYGTDFETGQYKGVLSNVVTFALLASLQSLNLFWLYCLFRAAYKFVVLNIAKDDRSEDDEEEEQEGDSGGKPVDGVSTGVQVNGDASAVATKRNGSL